MFAPVKGSERAYIKLKEENANNPGCKFPLHTLKDLTRGSYVFKTASELISFHVAFIENVQKNPKFKIYQVKNMFIDTKQENK